MEFIDFSKQLYRMCESTKPCEICRLRRKDGCLVDIPLNRVNGSFNDKQLARIEEIVEKWAAEHPIETRQSEFLKMFPDAKKGADEVLIFCPKNFSPKDTNAVHCHRHGCEECRKSYWLAEVQK